MKRDKLLAIGEALIDFAPEQIGVPLKDVAGFKKAVGGAPANVCGAFAKLGGRAGLVTQLGNDPFGDCIVEELDGFGIDTSCILRTDAANTALAFVSLEADGSRDFSFYRKPSADMLFEACNLKNQWFEDAYALHFCSVALVPSPMQDTHRLALQIAGDQGCIISFDPNVRLPLWDDADELRSVILEFMPHAHVLKISDEELEFITGCTRIEDALDILFRGNVRLVVYTKGSGGAECWTQQCHTSVPSRKVKAVDTTGAGDGFIGSFLYQLYRDGVKVDGLESLTPEQLEGYMTLSNRFCEYSVFGNGAIASYPDMKQLETYMRENP